MSVVPFFASGLPTTMRGPLSLVQLVWPRQLAAGHQLDLPQEHARGSNKEGGIQWSELVEGAPLTGHQDLRARANTDVGKAYQRKGNEG